MALQQADQFAAREALRDQQQHAMNEAAAATALQHDLEHGKLKDLAAEQNAAMHAERESVR